RSHIIIFLYLSLPCLSFLSPFASFAAALFSLSFPYSCLSFLAFLLLFHVQDEVILRVFLHDFHIFLLVLCLVFFIVLSLLHHFYFLFVLFPFLIDPSLLPFHISYLLLEWPFLSLMYLLILFRMGYSHQ